MARDRYCERDRDKYMRKGKERAKKTLTDTARGRGIYGKSGRKIGIEKDK